jgi:cytochrome c
VKNKPTIERRIVLAIAAATLLPATGAARAVPPVLKGDVAHGQQVFARCGACHMVGQGSGGRMGPTLNGVVGRNVGTVAGYNYSAALKNSGLKWDAPTLARFLAGPMKVVPGTKMAFPGLPNAQDQTDVVAYLQQYRADGTKK